MCRWASLASWRRLSKGFQIVASFPEWRRTPIILGESDPEGCAACSARTNPQNSYRNGPLYAAYTAETLNQHSLSSEPRAHQFHGRGDLGI